MGNTPWFAKVGAGYQFMDAARVGISYGHFGKLDKEQDSIDEDNGSILTLKAESSIQTIAAEFEYDLAQYEGFNFFVGAKAGVALIKEKVSAHNSITGNEEPADKEKKLNKKTLKNPLAGVSVGGSYMVADNVALDARVGYDYMGESKLSGRRNDNDPSETPVSKKDKYNLVYGEVGLRFHF